MFLSRRTVQLSEILKMAELNKMELNEDALTDDTVLPATGTTQSTCSLFLVRLRKRCSDEQHTWTGSAGMCGRDPRWWERGLCRCGGRRSY